MKGKLQGGKISDAHAYQQGYIYAKEIDSVELEDGDSLSPYEALHYASQAAPKVFSDKYDIGRFVAGVRGYYKQNSKLKNDE